MSYKTSSPIFYRDSQPEQAVAQFNSYLNVGVEKVCIITMCVTPCTLLHGAL